MTKRILNSGILVVWGSALTHLYFSGRVADYLHPAFRIYTALAGVVLLLMAAALLFSPAEETEATHDHEDGEDDHHGHDQDCKHEHVHTQDCEHDHDCGHDHASPKLPALIARSVVLIVPLLLTAGISPSQFSAATVRNRGFIEDVSKMPSYKPVVEAPLPGEDSASGEDSGPYYTQNAQGQIQTQPMELFYVSQEAEMRKDFENKEVELVGQYMPARADNPKGDRFDLVRMYVVCCAADAKPVAVTVQMKDIKILPEMSWVKVVGTAAFPVESGRVIPVVKASSVAVCDPPEETIIY